MIDLNQTATSGIFRKAISARIYKRVFGRIFFAGLLLLAATLACVQPLKAQNNLTRREFARLGVLDRARYFENAILSAATAEGVDPNLLWTIAYNETRFRPYLRSPAGAEGLMQFIPATAARYDLADPYNSLASIRASARYVRFLSGLFGNRIDSVLAAYNSGEGTVSAYLTGKTLRAGRKIINSRGVHTVGGVPPYRETIGYVGRGLIVYRWLVGRGVFPSNAAIARFPNQISAAVARVGLRDAELTGVAQFRVTAIVQQPSVAIGNMTDGEQSARVNNADLPTDAGEQTSRCESCESNSESELMPEASVYYDLQTGNRYLIRGEIERVKLAESGQTIVTSTNRSVPTTARSTFAGTNKPR